MLTFPESKSEIATVPENKKLEEVEFGTRHGVKGLDGMDLRVLI
jgi:hypothetical protein